MSIPKRADEYHLGEILLLWVRNAFEIRAKKHLVIRLKLTFYSEGRFRSIIFTLKTVQQQVWRFLQAVKLKAVRGWIYLSLQPAVSKKHNLASSWTPHWPKGKRTVSRIQNIVFLKPHNCSLKFEFDINVWIWRGNLKMKFEVEIWSWRYLKLKKFGVEKIWSGRNLKWKKFEI